TRGRTSSSWPITHGPKLSPISQFKSIDRAIHSSPHIFLLECTASDREGLSTAAACFFIGIHKLEACVEPFTHKIHLGTVDVLHAFGVYKQLDAVLFEEKIFRPGFIHVFHFVGQARTAGCLDSQPEPDTLTAFFQVASDVVRRSLTNRDIAHEYTFCLSL